MHEIKTILFGYCDVLDVPESWEDWRAGRDHLAARFQMTGEGFWRYLYGGSAWRQAVRGQITEAEFWADRLLPLGLHSEAERRALVAALFEGRMIHPTMRALLERLRGHYRLAILSNIEVRDFAAWLADVHDLEGWFEVVIGSADVGLAQPDAAIYALLLERLNDGGRPCAPPEVLFIDCRSDHLAAAAALGVQTVAFESPQALASALEARGVLTARVSPRPVLDGPPSS